MTAPPPPTMASTTAASQITFLRLVINSPSPARAPGRRHDGARACDPRPYTGSGLSDSARACRPICDELQAAATKRSLARPVVGPEARRDIAAQSSSCSSWILRVMVLRPTPSRVAASMRRPWVWRKVVRMTAASKSRASPSIRSGTPACKRRCDFDHQRRCPVTTGDDRRHGRHLRRSLRRLREGLDATEVGRRLLPHLERKVLDLDHLRRRQHRQPVAQVLQLAHVARKRQLRDEARRLLRQPLGLDAQLAARSSPGSGARAAGCRRARSRSDGSRSRITLRR